MTKTYLALALLITVLAGNAYGEDEVYYCVDTNSGGFHYDDQRKAYYPGNNTPEKFKMKFDGSTGVMEMVLGSLSSVPGYESLARQKFDCTHETLRDAMLNGEIFYTLAEARIIIERWRVHYNTKRPHTSLGYRSPAPEVIMLLKVNVKK